MMMMSYKPSIGMLSFKPSFYAHMHYIAKEIELQSPSVAYGCSLLQLPL